MRVWVFAACLVALAACEQKPPSRVHAPKPPETPVAAAAPVDAAAESEPTSSSEPLAWKSSADFVDEAVSAAALAVFQGTPGARDATVTARLKGRVEVEKGEDGDERWIVKLDIGGERLALVSERPKYCASNYEDSDDSDEIEEQKAVTRSIRIDLGKVDGLPVWLKLSASAVADLIVETPECARQVDVTHALAMLPTPDWESHSFTQFWKDEKWVVEPEAVPEMAGDLQVRVVGGGVELVDAKGDVSHKPRSMRAPDDDGCLHGSVSLHNHEGRTTAVQWEFSSYHSCEDSKEGFDAESGRESWVRTKDGSFELRSTSTPPSPLGPRTVLGDELEWRVMSKRFKWDFRVDWPEGADCGHEIYDRDYLSTWEVRQRGGNWKKLGETELVRYRRSKCSPYAGEP